MHFFFDGHQRPTKDEFIIHETPSYFELETRSSDPEMLGVSYFYVLPQSPTSMLVAACWGREPDTVAALFADPKFGSDWLKVFCEAYPVQGRLYVNGFQENYSDGALIRFNDPDDGEPKWSLVTVVGNIDPTVEPEDPSDANSYGLVGTYRFLAHPRMTAAYELVGGMSFLAAQEYVTNDISTLNKAKMVAKGAWQGYVDALSSGSQWISRLGGLSS